LRRTRAHGKRARAPEGRKGRKTGGEVRSGKNAAGAVRVYDNFEEEICFRRV